MKLKQRPEDFVVREAYRFDEDPKGPWRVYLMDKQKLSTFEAVQRISTRMRVPPNAISFCGLKDKQGRTEQLIAVRGKDAQMQEPDLRLKPLGRTKEPLSARNLTANRFAITVRDLGEEDIARLASSVAEVRRVGVVNYFDSQRFGALKHGQGFIAKDLLNRKVENALYNYMAKPSPLDKSDDGKVKKFWSENWGNWERHCPITAVARYRNILVHLRSRPTDWEGAFLKIEPRYRALLIFEYQSWLWNEGVRRLLQGVLADKDLISLRYQAGRLLFPREVSGEILRDLRDRTFPLLGPDTEYTDERTREAVEAVLQRERFDLRGLEMPHMPGMFFKHEERPLLVYPDKLVVSEARHDDLNKGRLKVNLAFTLPPGAYATLVTKRLFWFAMLEEEAGGREMNSVAVHALESAFGPGGGTRPRFKREKAPTRDKGRHVPRAYGGSDSQPRSARTQDGSSGLPPPGATADGAPLAPGMDERPATPRMGFRERQQRKKDERAAARAVSSAAEEARKAGTLGPRTKKPRTKRTLPTGGGSNK